MSELRETKFETKTPEALVCPRLDPPLAPRLCLARPPYALAS